MSERIGVSKFLGMTDLPGYGRDPGWLRQLGNMRVRPGGFLEMRGGLVRLKPSGGSAVNPVTAAGSGYLGAIDAASPSGWFRTFNNRVASWNFPNTLIAACGPNLAFQSWILLIEGNVGDRVLIGSDRPFSSATITLAQAATAGTTVTYKYGTADGAPPTYSNLTTTTTWDLTTAVAANSAGRATTLSWAMPTNWVPTTEGDATTGFAYKYWVEIKVTNWVGASVLLGHENIHSDWTGMNELYVAAGAPFTAANNARVSLYSNNVTTASWFDLSTSLFSGNSARHRFIAYRGILYFVNGIDDKRWDGSTLQNTGLPKPTQTFTIADGGASGTTWTGAGGTLQFRYAFTYGYGSQQVGVTRDLSNDHTRNFTPTLLGQSPPCAQTAVAYPAAANRITIADGNDVDISIAVQPPAGVDAIYIYRTEDLTNVPTSAVDSMPYYLVATILRNTAALFPVTPLVDHRIDYPAPKIELDQEDTTPPPRCKLAWVHKNRGFRANSDRFPARVWWSRPYQPDAFNTDEDFEDFSTTEGGRVTAGCEFMNQTVVFTEDPRYGIADVDEDQFQSYPIAPGVGCVAPESLSIGDGYLMWLARDGVYAWTGDGAPTKVSVHMDRTFCRMTFPNHGDSRAVIHNHQYELFLMSIGGAVPSDGFRYDLITNTWSTVGYSPPPLIVPFAVVTAPLGTQDAGIRHPFFGAPPKSAATNFQLYLGELEVTDDSAVIGITVDVHFGPGGYNLLKPDKVGFYYDTDTGWDTPILSVPTADLSTVGTGLIGGDLKTGNPDQGQEFSLIQGYFRPRGTGLQGLVVRFTANSVSTGLLWAQRVVGAWVEGEMVEPQRR